MSIKSNPAEMAQCQIQMNKTLQKRNDTFLNYVWLTLGMLVMVATLVGFCYQVSSYDFNKATSFGILLAFELLIAFFIHTVNGLFGSIAKIEEMIGD